MMNLDSRVHGTVTPDRKTVTSAGKVACHETKPERLFGLQGEGEKGK